MGLKIVFLVLVAALAVPVVVLLIECIAAALPRRLRALPISAFPRPRVAVLMPAHNEETVIGPTLQTILPQMRPHDTVLVVADNCTDTTAERARAAGATVVERSDPDNRGKGFALDFGLKQLAADAPAIVIMIDADCDVRPGAIDALVQQVCATQRPAQAVYLMQAPAQRTPRDGISALAFMVKNLVRPRGLDRLNLPCLLVGTGMAFPWKSIQNAPLANGNIVEDMQLGLELALAGASPWFCHDARVIGQLPSRENVSMQQRKRWEHGHLNTLVSQAPRLLKASLRQKRFDLAALAMELVVPPLSLLVMMLLALLLGTLVMGRTSGAWLTAWLAGGALAVLALAIISAWSRFGRRVLPLAMLASVPFYILWKIPIYFSFLANPQKAWNRTERDSAGNTPDPKP